MYAPRPSTNRIVDHRSIQEIQRKIGELAGKNELVKFFTMSNVKGRIAGWMLELNGILQVFNVC